MFPNFPEASSIPGPASRKSAAPVLWLRCALLGAAASGLLSSFSSAQDATAPQAQPPLAIIDGQPITEDQLPASDESQLLRMMQQVYSVKMRGLHSVVDQKLIEAEAKRKGVTPDQLFQTEVVAKVTEPTEDEIKAYYESRPEMKQQAYDAVKDKIRDGMKGVAISKARTIYVQGLMQQAMNDGELTLLIAPPKIEVTVDPARLRGDANAPVTIVEFSDFSCPFCRKAESTISEVLAKYPGQVKLGYRDFPLTTLHPQAELAAEASRCAGEQGKYWEYHDLLFARPDKQTSDVLLDDVRTLKLDDQKFEACLNGDRYKAQVQQDIQMGDRAGVVSTPGFFINGTFVSGAQPAATFEKVIDEKLAAAGQKQRAR
jgi:protein-disulfide isomerase